MDPKDQKSTTDYCETEICVEEAPAAPAPLGWKELYLKEDWWAIYLGIGLMLVTLTAFLMGSSVIKVTGNQPRRRQMDIIRPIAGAFSAKYSPLFIAAPGLAGDFRGQYQNHGN